MPTTTPNDTALLDGLDSLIGKAEIKLEKIWFNHDRPGTWQVSIRYLGEGGMLAGGGVDIRDAIQTVLTSIVVKRISDDSID